MFAVELFGMLDWSDLDAYWTTVLSSPPSLGRRCSLRLPPYLLQPPYLRSGKISSSRPGPKPCDSGGGAMRFRCRSRWTEYDEESYGLRWCRIVDLDGQSQMNTHASAFFLCPMLLPLHRLLDVHISFVSVSYKDHCEGQEAEMVVQNGGTDPKKNGSVPKLFRHFFTGKNGVGSVSVLAKSPAKPNRPSPTKQTIVVVIQLTVSRI